MAITATAGASKNLAIAASSLAFTASTLTNGRFIVVAVAILNTAVSVSSISDTVNTYTLQRAQNNGSAVRVEIWTAPVTAATASRTITVNFSGSTLASGAWGEYAGSTALGTVGTAATGTSFYPEGDVTTQDTASWAVCAVAAATSSGDTFTTDLGTIRQSIIPALTTAGVALVDSTSTAPLSLRNAVQLSASRAWAAAALELRTGVAATTLGTPVKVAPIAVAAQSPTPPPPYVSGSGGAVPVPLAALIKGGTVGVAYSETITAHGGVAPYTFAVTAGALPTGLSLSSGGVISGTPTVAATASFTVTATDSTLATGSTAFQIAVVAAPSAGGGSFAFLA